MARPCPPEYSNNGWTPFHRAADYGHCRIVKFFLKCGFDVSEWKRGYTIVPGIRQRRARWRSQHATCPNRDPICNGTSPVLLRGIMSEPQSVRKRETSSNDGLCHSQTHAAKCGSVGSKRRFMASRVYDDTFLNRAWSTHCRAAYGAREKSVMTFLSILSSSRRTLRPACARSVCASSGRMWEHKRSSLAVARRSDVNLKNLTENARIEQFDNLPYRQSR